jgi:hypothetical protein
MRAPLRRQRAGSWESEARWLAEAILDLQT